MGYTSYDTIGKGYDHTRRADPFLTGRIHALLELPEGAHVLDIGCGTGNYTIALHAQGLRLTGVDPADRMLAEARAKAEGIGWVHGKAEALPFHDAYFDGAVATLTTHHWADMTQGLREAHRVLKPGAPIIILTSTPEQMRRYWLCHYFPSIMARSCTVMPDARTTDAALTTAGFTDIAHEPYSVRPDLQDLFLYSAKDDPARYLDPEFRSGISTFAALSDERELQSGLERLERGIASGEWQTIRQAAEHDGGDYLFVKAVA
ncbi:MAG: methyltransferase domain-containing protein [Flavobacteriales bacterium]|nr:methyltransferase domain-containing protein [Flavobacteriales bacterium]